MKEYLVSISIEFIAAFFGFLSAIVLDNILEKRAYSQKLTLLTKNLCAELEDINTTLIELINSNSDLYYTIQIPSWDAMQNAGLTIELIEKPFFNDLISCYSLIKSINEILLFHKDDKIDICILKDINASINKLLESIKE